VLVSVLVDGLMRAGDYNARIPVEKLVSGVYFVEMQSGEFKEMQKISRSEIIIKTKVLFNYRIKSDG